MRLSHTLALCAACLAAASVKAEDYDFKVFCNGNPVGYHHVHVTRGEDETDVDIDADIDVTMAGIELYRYRHHSHEVWRDGKLTELVSETDDDGEAKKVSVRPAEDGMLMVESNKGHREISADTLPTSLWNPAILEQRELLDTESGKTVKVQVAQTSEGHYKMSGDMHLLVDYNSGRWSGLQFHYFGADVEFRPDQPVALGTP
jgi:hypothetical protein